MVEMKLLKKNKGLNISILKISCTKIPKQKFECKAYIH